jgi:monoamine oxidase
MDKIVDGFVNKVGKLIQYNTEVLNIDTSAKGVTVTVRDRKTGKRSNMNADYCISNIPLPILSKIKNNFSDDFAKAVETCVYDPTCKLGWQANERFWENERTRSTAASATQTIQSRKCGIPRTTTSLKTERSRASTTTTRMRSGMAT